MSDITGRQREVIRLADQTWEAAGVDFRTKMDELQSILQMIMSPEHAGNVIEFMYLLDMSSLEATQLCLEGGHIELLEKGND